MKRLASLLLLVSLAPWSARAAISQSDLDAANGNWVWFNPTDSINTPLCTSGSSQTNFLPDAVPASEKQTFIDAANQYQIAPALLAAVFWMEHGRGFPPPTGPWAHSGVSDGSGVTWADGTNDARGPFQFEPGTWWNPGNRAGYVNSNPHHQVDTGNAQAVMQSADDFTDAAYGAAKLLANNGAKTTNQTGTSHDQPNTWYAAVYSYNHSDSYVKTILAQYSLWTCSSSTPSGTGTIPKGFDNPVVTQSGPTFTPVLAGVPAGGYPTAGRGDKGQCVWWTAYNRNLPVMPGNATDWINDAQAAHLPIGQTPVPGAIAVYHSGPTPAAFAGHVGVVIAVTPTSYTISEMNWAGWNVVDNRTLPWPDTVSGPVHQEPLEGFILP